MNIDRRARRGAVAVSAGVLLGAFNLAAIANADPDSESTNSAADRASSSQPTKRPAAGPRRNSAPVGSAASARASVSRPDRSTSRATPPSPAGTIVTLPVRVADTEPAAPSVRTQPPRITSAGPAPAAAVADESAGRYGSPLQSPVAWATLAAARNEITRRPGGVSTDPKPAAGTTSLANASATQPVGQVVSPLGTPEQTAAEATAMQTVRTLPVLAMKSVLGLAWRVIGGIQYSDVGGPDKANLAALRNAVDEWAMGSAFQLMILNSNEPTIVAQVAPPHQWYGQNVTGSRILYDNPDTIYRFTGVNYASEYVITGTLPDDPKSSFSVLTGTTGTTVAVLDAADLELGPDRSFVITVSGSPAQPGQKNHLEITPETTLIAIRDTLSDWNTEDPMALAIHRTAGPPNSLFSQFGGFAIPVVGPAVAKSPFLTKVTGWVPPLPVVPPFIRGAYASLLMLRGITEESKYIKVATTDPVTGERKAPNVFTDPTANASFLSTQLQSAGYFQLADDQALVLTIHPNNAGYFVAPVTNDWTITDNYWDQQTSLNNVQAQSNPDGSYTIVVSPTEPDLGEGTSVWNWVSTGGLNQGTMAIRFQSIDPLDPHKPTVSSQVVPLSELVSVLPEGSPLITPVGREVQLAARGEGFNRRFAPYPQAAG